MTALHLGAGFRPKRWLQTQNAPTPAKGIGTTAIRGHRGFPGPGFKLEEIKHAAINNPEGEPLAHARAREEKGLRPGGLGLLLTKQMVDELVYNEAHNQVVLIKYL